MPRPPTNTSKGVTHSRGSPRRSFRWHYTVFDQLAQVEADHEHKVTVNRIASVAIEWGLAFLGTLDRRLQARVLGAKGAKPLTFRERDQVREELRKKLGTKAGAFKLNARLGFAVPQPLRESIETEAKALNTSMSAVGRRRLTEAT